MTSGSNVGPIVGRVAHWQQQPRKAPKPMSNAAIRKKTGVVVLAILFAGPAIGPAQDPPSASDPAARSIVEKADLVRFPAEGFQVDVNITTTRKGQRAEGRKYRVMSKGNENTIVLTLEPASEQGQSMLMKGRDLWI